MSRFEVKGWCPGALKPMLSGDGLIVRVRPHGGRLTNMHARGIAATSERYGNGLIDLTSRANLQIRGISEATYSNVLADLSALGLLDAHAAIESERNIVVSPFSDDHRGQRAMAERLEAVLARDPIGLPSKFGFAIDCGHDRHLVQSPADIRIERSTDGAMIVRADGAEKGRSTDPENCVALAIALAHWFRDVTRQQAQPGRMASLIARGVQLPLDLAGDAFPVRIAEPPEPGVYEAGALVGVAFGQLTFQLLSKLAALGDGLRITPWRMVLVEGLAEMPGDEDLISNSSDALLRVVACTGAPRCPQANAPTRAIARRLAGLVPRDSLLHVSGCSKGCAHRGVAALTLVATPDGFDFVRDGTTLSHPVQRSLPADALSSTLVSLAGAS